ncbi:U-box domain-containing protein 35-like [Impatiens glandulifera]|uniref:U-box domain-containing protein 35-like n=1 Tax=Impatiens glandulifera TaxID=253017 RepID=UPI001FB0C425|nr:U-box domain-containing protein 35-like [Impatiens glandulifera]
MDGRENNKEMSNNKLVAVAVDKDNKGCQIALKWAIDNILIKGQTLVLIHVNSSKSQGHTHFKLPFIKNHSFNSILFYSIATGGVQPNNHASSDQEHYVKEFFLPFRCFCTRKEIKCFEVMLHDTDVTKALVEYVAQSAIDVLVMGATSKGGILRFKSTDVPSSVSKNCPDFCTAYVISKGKISSTRAASRTAPQVSQLRSQILNQSSEQSNSSASLSSSRSHSQTLANNMIIDGPIKSIFTHRKDANSRSYGGGGEFSDFGTSMTSSSSRSNTEISFVSGRDSFESNRMPTTSFISNMSDDDARESFESFNHGRKSTESMTHKHTQSFDDSESDVSPSSSQEVDDVDIEMRRLKQQLKQTMEMYSSACKEALTAKQKTKELQRWKTDEQQKMVEMRSAEDAALAMVEREKEKSKAAIEHAEAAQRIAEIEAHKRINAEMKLLKEAEEKNKMISRLNQTDIRYRKYSIEDIEKSSNFFSDSLKIGEGGYGPVYKCMLDHTPTAVKVLRPDAAQGRSQFQREIEVLSCIRHPHMVLLLGACPEYGCLVYEYMSNGSLEDILFRKRNNPPLTWQQRFRIAAEIGSALLFLHQAKPEPIVHRDLKPGNILLDQNYVSKISDVGLARLVPPSMADNVTQYRMTSTAGTFCYIDPEYQQTGMLGVKSDIYSLGIMFLQIITAKAPMGLTHQVERAIEKGTFEQILDPEVTNWPVEEALLFAKISLQCAELRRKDRPDLSKVVMPELERLRDLKDNSDEDAVPSVYSGFSRRKEEDSMGSADNSQVSIPNDEIMSPFMRSGYDSSQYSSSTT